MDASVVYNYSTIKNPKYSSTQTNNSHSWEYQQSNNDRVNKYDNEYKQKGVRI